MSRSAVLAIVGLLALPFLSGCAVGRLDAVPSALAGDLSFASVQNARFSGDDGASLADEMFRSIAHERATGAKPGPWSFLALSGGQEDGAFGAGLLVGWSRHGGRPQFKIVTGTSTGALAAPFAFLGSEYDATLEQMYTTTGSDDVVSVRFLTAAVNGDALRRFQSALRKHLQVHDSRGIAAHRPGVSEGPTAAHFHRQSRFRQIGDLEHRRHRRERQPDQVALGAQDPFGVRRRAGVVPTGDARRPAGQ